MWYFVNNCLKGQYKGQYFEILFLDEFPLSWQMQLLIYEYKKKNSKIPSGN